MTSSAAEVVVVGAGPSGLFAAHELARHGIRPRVFERTPEPHHQARATALQPATLEILARAGILDDVLAVSHPIPYARVLDRDLDVVSETPFAGVGCRWEFQASLPQYSTEEVLTRHLQTRGVSVERGVTVSSVQRGDDVVLVNLQRSDGTLETVEADRVIGAGGAESVTRQSMQEILPGETYPGTALVGDIKLDCGAPRTSSNLIATRHGYVLLAPLPGGRWITFVGLLDDDELQRLSADRSLASVAAAIQRRITADVELEEVAWSSLFHMHRRQAPSLGGQRRFLLGDAGHLSSPFGGEGLNAGLHDAHNLAWKLALVLRGRGRATLLDSFAYEREIADRHGLEVADRLHGLVDRAVRAERTGIRPPPATDQEVRALMVARSMLDVTYPGSPIIGAHPPDPNAANGGPAPGERYPDACEPVTSHQLLLPGAADRAAADRLRDRWRGLVEVIDPDGAGERDRGSILIRPDGYVGFRTAAADETALEAVDSHLASYLIPS